MNHPNLSTPIDILNEAATVLGDRNDEYGGPFEMHIRISEYWNTYLGDYFVGPQDVAMMLLLMKVARINLGVPRRDNYVDLAGYASIAGELSELLA